MLTMKIVQAKRQRTSVKIAVQGPSGSGKTMSSLLMAAKSGQSDTPIPVQSDPPVPG